ncbi:hypothetical protein EmuJ_000135200 [Echinococcus multilocularis]|uniref:Uncharacterized protein n=1 Tax=Echinococcus multilocularis TaxID=6211 RepID=A0A087VZH5_ECHMU|nr:hypothetical protein EmuJ_000135200 [Echinococcus multilocularis]
MNHISADHWLKGLCNRPVIDKRTWLEESQWAHVLPNPRKLPLLGRNRLDPNGIKTGYLLLPSDSTSERGKRRSVKMNFIQGPSSLIPEEDEEEASSECV